jgi:alpha-L-fucosidase 2
MNRPAASWSEAFPLGNGHFGAMIYGGVLREQIDLSALTFFSGTAQAEENCPAKGWEAFAALRQATLEGDYEQAKELTADFMGIRRDFGTNLPVGQLLIERQELSDAGVFSEAEQIQGSVQPLEYERCLDLDQACCSVRFRMPDNSRISGMGYDCFASHADRAIIGRLLPGPAGVIQAAFKIEGECLGQAKPRLVSPDELGSNDPVWHCGELLIQGQALETLHSSGTCGTRIALVIRVLCSGGQLLCESNRLIVKQASSCLMILTLETDFTTPAPLQAALKRQAACLESARTVTRGCLKTDEIWNVLFQRHLADFRPIMKRVRLRLGPHDPACWDKPAERSVDELIDSPEECMALTALMFQYGRYLLISSSREDSPIPAPLQGVWNDQVACRIGWSCDMHLDINTQMNYWPAELTGLPECVFPLFRWMQERLIPAGRITAENCYNRPGWVAELVSNAWGFAAPYWSPTLCPCPTGGAWLINQVWEHYLYQPDIGELRAWIFPVLAETAKFFSTYLFEIPGSPWLHSGPSISPENEFLINGVSYYASISCTYEITVIRDVFTSFERACQILDHSGLLTGEERELWQIVRRQIPRLPPFRVTDDGTLAEWSHDFPARDPQHRHMSHLLGLYPYGQITPEMTPELARAAAASIRKKLNPPDLWEDTGWSRSLLMLYASRLHDGDAAWVHMQAMFRVLTLPDLLIRHPPTRGAPSFADVYELDGNTGLCACVADLLLQSHLETLDLLPSLPAAWTEGEISGLRARGQVQVDLTWRDGRLRTARLISPISQERVIRYQDNCQTVRLTGDRPLILSFS